jgi:N-acetylglucosaminyldiphosphoundecaprenol N-acetyl-beta-D-mannosaminyltransferase
MFYNGVVKMQNKIDSTRLLFGLPIFSKDKERLLALLHSRLNNKSGVVSIATPNPEQIVLAKQDNQFNQYLHQFDLLLPDGQGLVWASQLLASKTGQAPLTERIAGREVVAELLTVAQQLRLKVLIVGGRGYRGKSIKVRGDKLKRDVAKQCKVIEVGGDSQEDPTAFSESNNAGPLYWTPAYVNVATPTTVEEEQLSSLLRQLEPDLVLVAFGAPHQEAWIINHLSLLEQQGVSLTMAVGGSFDYLLKTVPQAPNWISKIGLEWLFRLVTQPWRWKRQLALITFIGMTLQEMRR